MPAVKAEEFYKDCLRILNKSQVPFMVGGTYAFNAYSGVYRPTGDLDIFCKAGDFPKILQIFKEQGFRTQVTDERWIAKVLKGKYQVDLIFNSAIAVTPVNDDWFKESQSAKVLEIEVKLLPPTELIWSKVFVQARDKYHGHDIAHLIMLKHKEINWKRLLSYMDQYWEVLLIHILNFRFAYPSERELVPRWLLDELLTRLQHQINLPTPKEKVCRGRILSPRDYEVDVREWGFSDLIGWRYESK